MSCCGSEHKNHGNCGHRGHHQQSCGCQGHAPYGKWLWTKAEKIEWLEERLASLQEAVKLTEERIAAIQAE